jgi:predicted RNase H-like nuclease (RuvC/YqgF family)
MNTEKKYTITNRVARLQTQIYNLQNQNLELVEDIQSSTLQMLEQIHQIAEQHDEELETLAIVMVELREQHCQSETLDLNNQIEELEARCAELTSQRRLPGRGDTGVGGTHPAETGSLTSQDLHFLRIPSFRLETIETNCQPGTPNTNLRRGQRSGLHPRAPEVGTRRR